MRLSAVGRVCGAAIVASLFWTGAAAKSFELLPGALVDLERNVILVMQPGSGIAVLDALTGQERCSTKHAARPLLLHGSRLLAQTESGGSILRLYVFELEASSAGEDCNLLALHEVEIQLPTQVVTAIDERIDGAFDVRAWYDGAAVVEWSFRDSPAFPSSFAEKGRFRVDLATGGVGAAPESTVGAEPAVRAMAPVPTAEPRKVVVDTDVVSIAVQRRTDGTRSVTLDRHLAVSGSRLDSRVLYAGDVRALRLASDDRSLLAASLAAGAPPAERYVWSIYDLTSGRKQGELRAGRSNSPFFVHDSVVVYRDDRSSSRGGKAWVERPVRLVAQSLSDQVLIWSYPIRDTAYRGTRPPRQPNGNGSGR